MARAGGAFSLFRFSAFLFFSPSSFHHSHHAFPLPLSTRPDLVQRLCSLTSPFFPPSPRRPAVALSIDSLSLRLSLCTHCSRLGPLPSPCSSYAARHDNSIILRAICKFRGGGTESEAWAFAVVLTAPPAPFEERCLRHRCSTDPLSKEARSSGFDARCLVEFNGGKAKAPS